MRLYIVRHGEAHKDSPTAADSDRALRPRGERQARWLGEQLAQRNEVPARIIASPFVRAITTARLINESIGAPLERETTLGVGHAAEFALRLVRTHADTDESIMLVGHNPQLEALAGAFCAAAGHPFHGLRTGEACVFDLSPEGALEFVENLRLEETTG